MFKMEQIVRWVKNRLFKTELKPQIMKAYRRGSSTDLRLLIILVSQTTALDSDVSQMSFFFRLSKPFPPRAHKAITGGGRNPFH